MSKTVFISHAKEDADTARKLNADLERNGFFTWFDEKDLLPGQNWQIMIKQAIKKSDYFITLLSTRSVTKRGFVQAEQKLAYNVMDEMPESSIFIIPVRLNDCEIPYNLADRHYIDFFPDYDKGLVQLLRGLGVEPNDYHKENVFSGNESGKFDIPLPKLKKKISQRDKDIFVKKTFEVIKQYFNIGLSNIENSYEEIETDFTDIHNLKFVCKIYVNGDVKKECKIWVGGFSSNNISYVEGHFLDINNDNSFNDWLSIEDDGSTIYFEPFNKRTGYPDAEERIEKSEKAAEYLWKRFTGFLEIQL